MNFASGASLVFATGTLLNASGTATLAGKTNFSNEVDLLDSACMLVKAGGSIITAGHVRVDSGASLHVNDGASLIIKDAATGNNNPVAAFNVGNNRFWFAAGSAGSPTFTASAGDLLWIANSASTSLWVNAVAGVDGASWLVLAKTLATSATLGAT